MRIKNLYLSAISFVLAILVFVVSGALIKNDGHGMGIAAIFVGLAIVAVAVLALLNFIFGKKDNFIIGGHFAPLWLQSKSPMHRNL